MLKLLYSPAGEVLTAFGFNVTPLNVFGLVYVSAMIVAASILLYLLPTFIADERKHQHRVPISLLNLLLGWTFLGWVGAIVWATMPINPAPLPVLNPAE
jgi:hypothetical protein